MKWLFLGIGIIGAVNFGVWWYLDNIKAMIGYGILIILGFMFAGLVRIAELLKESK